LACFIHSSQLDRHGAFTISLPSGPALANAALPALGGGAAAAAAAPFCGAMALGMRAVDALDDARRRRTP
jgi:hypothetical protein